MVIPSCPPHKQLLAVGVLGAEVVVVLASLWFGGCFLRVLLLVVSWSPVFVIWLRPGLCHLVLSFPGLHRLVSSSPVSFHCHPPHEQLLMGLGVGGLLRFSISLLLVISLSPQSTL